MPGTSTALDKGNISAKDLLDRVDDLYRGESSQGRMTMTIRTAHWKRTLSLEFWNKGKEQALMRILSPAKEKGTATLRSGGNVWNYLPKVNRIIKVPSSMMGRSWMGSHYTNDDLVKESRMAEDYEVEITFQGMRDGNDLIEITCTPKPEAVVVWGLVIVEIYSESYLPHRLLYFNEDLELARSMEFGDIRDIGSRRIPTLSRIIPADKPEEFTEVHYDKMDFDTEVKDSRFSLRSLQR